MSDHIRGLGLSDKDQTESPQPLSKGIVGWKFQIKDRPHVKATLLYYFDVHHETLWINI